VHRRATIRHRLAVSLALFVLAQIALAGFGLGAESSPTTAPRRQLTAHVHRIAVLLGSNRMSQSRAADQAGRWTPSIAAKGSCGSPQLRGSILSKERCAPFRLMPAGTPRLGRAPPSLTL